MEHDNTFYFRFYDKENVIDLFCDFDVEIEALELTPWMDPHMRGTGNIGMKAGYLQLRSDNMGEVNMKLSISQEVMGVGVNGLYFTINE